MLQGDKGRSTIFFSTILLFVALFVMILFLIPRINRLKVVSGEAAKKKSEYEMGLVKVMVAQQAVEAIKQAKAESDLLGVAIPDSPQADEALLQISSLASDSSLKIVSAEVVSSKEGILRVAVTAKGSFENTVGFVSKLKNNLRPNKIVDLNMTRSADDISTDLTLDFPYLYSSAKSPVSKQTAVD